MGIESRDIMTDKISIIIPTYNNGKAIKRCISALLAQDYPYYEAIIIDDGSTDATSAICDQITDPRFIVKHTSNHGVSIARNIGLKLATGEYICFCDGDDYYESDFLSKMYRAIKSTDSDLVICNYYVVHDGIKHKESKCRSKQITRLELIQGFTSTNNYGGFACNKIFKSNLVKTIRFPPDIAIMEDTLFLMSYLMYCQRVYFISDPLYCYCESNTAKNLEKLVTQRRDDIKYLESYDRLLANFNLSSGEINLIRAEMAYMAVNIRLELPKITNVSIKLKNRLKDVERQNLAQLIFNPCFNWKKKLKTIRNLFFIKFREK